MKVIIFKKKDVWFDNLVASVWISSLGEKYYNRTCNLLKANSQFPRQGDVKSHKAAIQVFSVVKDFQGTIIEMGVDGSDYGVFKFVFLQFIVFQYFTLKFSAFKYFKFRLKF